MDGWLLEFAAQVASTYGYVDVEVTVVMCMLQNTLWQRVMYTRLARVACGDSVGCVRMLQTSFIVTLTSIREREISAIFVSFVGSER
jgi:hypothetical protein